MSELRGTRWRVTIRGKGTRLAVLSARGGEVLLVAIDERTGEQAEAPIDLSQVVALVPADRTAEQAFGPGWFDDFEGGPCDS